MGRYVIKDLRTLKKYCSKINNPILAVGARPYNLTFGVYNLFKNFEILACKGSSQEARLLEKKLKITYLPGNSREFRSLKTYKNYSNTKRPEDLFRNKKVVDYLVSLNKPVLLFFKKTLDLEKSLLNKPFISVGSNFKLSEKYENNIHFQKLLDELNIPSPKHTSIKARLLNYKKIVRSVGPKFVIQLPGSALGTGTFFVLTKRDFEKIIRKPLLRKAIKDNTDLKIAEFIHRDSSPSMTICVTKSGVLYTGLQKQIIDVQEVLEKGRRSGIFCGHDWSNSHFPANTKKQAAFIANKIGMFLKNKEGFRGIFGIDFVLEKETRKLYPIEANVRLLGSFPLLSMIQEHSNQPVIQAVQIIDTLDRDDYRLDIRSLNFLMSRHKEGSHLNIYAKNKGLSYISKNIKPGIYQVDDKNKKVIFLRDGLFFEDLKNNNEVLLTGGIPYKSRVYKEHANICKLISRNSFLDDSDKLSAFAKIVVAFVYKNLGVKKLK
jgi:hypothetical protein